MDISRIRKKIKKAKERDEQKTRGSVKKEIPEKPDNENKAISDVVDTTQVQPPRVSVEKTGLVVTVKKEENADAELPDVKAEGKPVPEKETEILAFKVASEEYAVEIDKLQEILKIQRIAALPRSPEYLKGITSVRGKIMPVLDLKKRLGLAEENEGKEKIIVLFSRNEPFGALVGEVLGVFKISANELLPPPSTLTDGEKSFISGVVKIDSRFISILKVDEIFKMEVL